MTTSKAHTKSINVASFLLSRGIPLDHAEPHDGRVTFIFNISDDSLAVQECAYHAGAQVSAFALLSALTQLKKLVKQIIVA